MLFTLRAEDRHPLAQSRAVRVFHGFGDGELRFRGQSGATSNEVILAFDCTPGWPSRHADRAQNAVEARRRTGQSPGSG